MASKVEIKVEIAQVFNNNDTLTLQPMKDGKEDGKPFEIRGKSFMRSFHSRTAKPEGTQELNKAQFQVKKKSSLK